MLARHHYSRLMALCLSVACLIVLIGCSQEQPQLVSGQGECIGGMPIEIAFYDDFSSIESGWPTYSIDSGYCGSAIYCESDYRISDQQSEYYIIIKKRRHSVPFLQNRTLGEYSNFAIQVDCRLEPDEVNGSYGLAFRRSLDSTNGYRFIISTTGYYHIEKVADGEFSLLVDYTYSDSINKNGTQTNSLMVVCNGPEIKVCVNGHLLTTVYDDFQETGHVALFAATDEQPDVSFYFDNFYIYTFLGD